jgi:Na+-driven multidrug efflux pump
MTKRQALLLQGSIPRALWSLAVPIILGNVLQTGYQLTDAFWVGRLGAALAMAGATLTSQYMGAGRQDMVNHVAAQTMLMVVVTSIVFGALGYALAPLLLKLLGVAQDVYINALGFLRVSFVGIIFVFTYAMF